MAKNFAYASLLDVYGELLSEKQKELMNMYYNEDLSLSEIAENTDITRQGVHTAIKHCNSQLDEYESKLHFCEKITLMKSVLDEKNFDKLAEIIDSL